MKNTKVIIAVIAFAVTFIFSAGLVKIIFPAPAVQYVYVERPLLIERSNTNEIETFLLRDINNGDSRDNSAESVMDYWQASSSMDASRFPRDFQKVWSEHMQAWHNYAEYRMAVKNSPSRRDSREAVRLNGEINRTWEIVKSVGRTYGAYVE